MNKLELYHVSIFEYNNGEILETMPSNETYYYKKKKEEGLSWVDDLLNLHKPPNAPLRQNTFYAFDSFDNCVIFGQSQKLQNPYYYEVLMVNPYKVPMCLVDLISKSEEDFEKQITIAHEYWNSPPIWKYNEFLSSKMTIVESIKQIDKFAIMRGKENYQHDFDLIKKRF